MGNLRVLLRLTFALLAVSCGPSPANNDLPDESVIDASPPLSVDAAVPASTARFVAMGDTGKGTEEQYAVAEAVRTLCAKEGCDFILLLGDNIYDSGADSVDDPAWEERFERPYAGIDIPFYAVLGNHDYGGHIGPFAYPGLGNEPDRGPNEVAYSTVSDRWKMPANHYTVRQGPVGFIMLDTNATMWADTSMGDQREWWPTALAEVGDAPWVIAAGHHPYRSNGAHGNAGDYSLGSLSVPFDVPQVSGSAVKAFFDDLVCGHVTIYLSAHDHTRQWLDAPDACGGTELLVSGAGAEVKAFARTDTPARWQDDRDLGFLYVVADETSLVGRFVDVTGATSFEHTLTR